jgi:hypothetical protein
MHHPGSALFSGLALLLALSSPRASAETPAPLAQLLGDPAEQREVIQGAARAPVMQQNPCASAEYAVEKKLAIYRQPAFDSTGKVVAGAWKQLVDEQGCGARRLLNVVVIAQSSGGYAVLPLLPGTTHADPVLQRDALRFVVQAAATAPGAPTADCPRPYVADTEFLGQDATAAAGTKEPAWSERWTYVACTKRLEIPVRFLPDATGTTVSAGPSTAITVTTLDAPGS